MTSIAVRSWLLGWIFIQMGIFQFSFGSDLLPLGPGIGMVDDDIRFCSHHGTCQNRCGSTPNDAPCYCDSHCEFYGDCCHDYRTSCTDDKDSTVTLWTNHTTCVKNGGNNFYLISSCPSEMTDENVRFNCENPYPNDLLLKIPVSDNNNLAYANIFCALCNGITITNVKAWEVTASCMNNDDNWSSSENEQSTYSSTDTILSEIYRAEHCYYEYTPTGNSHKRNCYEPEVKDCPIGYHDEEVAIQCRSYTAAVYVDTVRYANPHCALCHGEDDYTCHKKFRLKPSSKAGHPGMAFDTANAMDTPGVYESSDYNSADLGETIDRLPVVPITILIDFSTGGISVKTPTKRARSEGFNCGSGRVFNPFTGECINTLCEEDKILTEYGCTERMQPLKQVTVTSIPREVIELMCACISFSNIQIQYSLLNESTLNGVVTRISSLITGYNASSVEIKNLDSLNVLISFKTSNCQLLEDVFTLIFYQAHASTTDEWLQKVTMIQTCEHDHNMLLGNEECITQTLDASNLHIYQSNIIEVTDGVDNFTITDQNFRVNMTFYFENQTTISAMKLMNCGLEDSTHPTCPLISLKIKEFLITENNTWIYYNTGHRFSYEDITISNDTVLVCSFFFQNGTIKTPSIIFIYDETLQLINLVGVSCSLLGLLLTFIVSFLGKDLRTTSGKIVMNIAISLFFAQLGTLFAGTFVQYKLICTVIAALLHYLWLVSFMCMFVMSLTLFKSFRSFKSSIKCRNRRQPTKLYLIGSWGIPLIFVGTMLIIDFFDCLPFRFSYGDDTVCWIRDEFTALIFFGIPSATILTVNSFLFLVITFGIHRSKKNSRKIRGSTKSRDVTSNIVIYAKISCIMGLTWTTGCLASFLDQTFIWYIFVILNSLQGLFIFASFSAKKLMVLLKNKQKKSPNSHTRTIIQESCRL